MFYVASEELNIYRLSDERTEYLRKLQIIGTPARNKQESKMTLVHWKIADDVTTNNTGKTLR